MKLGEALVKEALITRQQLDLALQRQVLFGGRIGTNLLELRTLEENELTAFLGRFYKVPPVSPEMIASIEEDVLNSLSRETVEKYKVLPFKKERNRLHAAVLDPKDIRAIDELRFLTGFDIIPYAITEMRILYALEKYYGIKRELRYIPTTDRFDPEMKVEEYPIDKIKASFTEVNETEEIAGILIQVAYRIAARVGVFMVKGGKVVGWKGKGLNVDGFEMSGGGESIVSDVLNRRSYYRGPVLNIKGNEPLIKILSGTPQDVLLVPIDIRERVIALLYVDNGNTSVLDAKVSSLMKVASMAAIAFEIILLKKKIRDL
jgi:hypothetical protein